MYYCKARSIETDEPVYQRLKGGPDYYFLGDSRVGRDNVRIGVHEQPVINWAMDNFVKDDKVCIDIGAHVGVWALQMARKAKHVHAFECSPKTFNYLCANIALQDLNYSINKYNVALSNKEGVSEYYMRDKLDGGGNGLVKFNQDGDNMDRVEVPTITLDSFGFKNIGFIKIDVEGHEKQVLEGAVNTLKENNYPPFVFESWIPNSADDHNIPRTMLRKELFDYIVSLGYKIHPVAGWPEQFLAVHA